MQALCALTSLWGLQQERRQHASSCCGKQGPSGDLTSVQVEAERSDQRCEDWLHSEKDNVDDVVSCAGPGYEEWCLATVQPQAPGSTACDDRRHSATKVGCGRLGIPAQTDGARWSNEQGPSLDQYPMRAMSMNGDSGRRQPVRAAQSRTCRRNGVHKEARRLRCGERGGVQAAPKASRTRSSRWISSQPSRKDTQLGAEEVCSAMPPSEGLKTLVSCAMADSNSVHEPVEMAGRHVS